MLQLPEIDLGKNEEKLDQNCFIIEGFQNLENHKFANIYRIISNTIFKYVFFMNLCISDLYLPFGSHSSYLCSFIYPSYFSLPFLPSLFSPLSLSSSLPFLLSSSLSHPLFPSFSLLKNLTTFSCGNTVPGKTPFSNLGNKIIYKSALMCLRL